MLACGANNSPGEQIEPPAKASAGQDQASDSPADTGARGEVSIKRFHSVALGVDKKYWLYLPESYADSEQRFPVIYMLHGLGGRENNWVEHMGLAKAADAMGLQAIVVMPDGDDSFYVNSVTPADYDACLQSSRPFGKTPSMRSYCVKSANYEDYIARDLVAHVDASYRTIADRSARGIGGLSMGGYGALLLAMKHKDLFASVASHSGVAALLYEGPFPFAAGQVKLAEDVDALTGRLGPFGNLLRSIYGDDLSHWRAHDPAVLAKDLRDGELAIYLDCGTEDEFRLQHGASYLHEVLSAAEVSHAFVLVPGRHDAHFWMDRIDDSLAFHAENLAGFR